MEAEQQDLRKRGGTYLAWSRLSSLERGWNTASCLARTIMMFPYHQAASPGVLELAYRRTYSAGSDTSTSGINEPSFTEG